MYEVYYEGASVAYGKYNNPYDAYRGATDAHCGSNHTRILIKLNGVTFARVG